MGLGPPVCLDCERIMAHFSYPPFWVCLECGQNNGGERVSSLFCLSPEDAEKYKAKENTP